MGDPDDRRGASATSEDALLGGRLAIRQPTAGHRVGTDAILLAAAAPAMGVTRLADIGAGAGAVGLALLQRLDGATADLVERDADLAALAQENALSNGLQDRARILCVDVADARERRSAGLLNEAADLVVTNPPFFDARNVRVSPDAKRANAHVFGPKLSNAGGLAPLEAWILASLSLLRAGGRFIVIHRPDALAQILSAFGRRLGAVAILPIHASAQAPAHRVLIAGVKGAKGPISLRPGMILHDQTGGFAPLVQAIHRGEALIDWGDQPRRRAGARPSQDDA